MMRCFGIVLLVGLFLPVSQAQAVEYRLQVVNMWDSGFNAFVKPGELGDGASGPGLEDLVASLDRGGVSRGPLLSDRTFRWASETVARAYGAVHVLAEIKPGGEGKARWDEVRWDGKPGERSVWVVEPSGRGRPQQLYHVVLKATGPARHFIPYVPTNGQRLVTVRYALEFLWFHEERGGPLGEIRIAQCGSEPRHCGRRRGELQSPVPRRGAVAREPGRAADDLPDGLDLAPSAHRL